MEMAKQQQRPAQPPAVSVQAAGMSLRSPHTERIAQLAVAANNGAATNRLAGLALAANSGGGAVNRVVLQRMQTGDDLDSVDAEEQVSNTMASTRGVEHVDNSCYVASVLNLIAATPGYRDLFDPLITPVAEDSPGHRLQVAISPLIQTIAGDGTVRAEPMRAVIRLLAEMDLIQGAETEQQDATQILMGILARLPSLDQRLQTRESRQYENGETTADDQSHDILQIFAHGQRTLEEALAAEFVSNRPVVDGVENPHNVTRRATSFPPVLSIAVGRASPDDAIDMPMTFTVPAEIMHDGQPGPRYQLQGFIARNTFSHLSGGHYVAIVRGDQEKWFESDDMGQAKGETEPGIFTPQTREIDLPTHTVGGNRGAAWTMATLYTYVRVEDQDTARVNIGQLPPRIVDHLDADLDSGKQIPSYMKDQIKEHMVFSSGSTRPAKVEMPDHSMKVMKYGKDEDHLLTEVLSNKLYQAAGIGTLKTELIRVYEDQNDTVGKLAQITDFVENVQAPDMVDLMQSPDFARHVGTDMVFANWDLFKTDNWMKVGGRMVRSDNGGALDRRAQGDLKSKEEWSGSDVKEFSSMRQKENSPYRNLTDKEIADSIRTLAFNLTPDRIDRAMAAAHFPEKKREELKKILLDRIDRAIAYADRIYPMAKTITVDKGWSTVPKPKEAETDEPLDPIEELRKLGWTNLPGFPLLEGEAKGLFRRAPSFDAPHFMSFEPSETLFKPPEVNGRTNNPNERLPLVGPEELLNKRQFGGGVRESLVNSLPRIRTGRLVRRMSDGEKAAFEKAASAKSIEEIVALLFPTTGKGLRGEMVLSVNEPYVFEREKAAMLGKDYTGNEEKHDPKDYHWVMEIPVTEEMLRFLTDYCHVQAPHEGSKPAAFMGNPNLKNEGQAGGRGGEGGIPNVVLKREGFASFWHTVSEIRFVEAEDHLWKARSNNDELIKARELKIREEKIKKAAEEKAANKKALDDTDPFEGGLGLFGQDDS